MSGLIPQLSLVTTAVAALLNPARSHARTAPTTQSDTALPVVRLSHGRPRLRD
jgi:hypothetical protein